MSHHLEIRYWLVANLLIAQMMSLHFSADLYPVVKDRTAMLYWIMDPAVQGVVIAYDLGGNQVLLHQYDVSIFIHRRIYR